MLFIYSEFNSIEIEGFKLKFICISQVIPNLEENICKLSDVDYEASEKIIQEQTDKIQLLPKHSGSKLFNVVPFFPQDFSLELISSKWINKQISNFDYLMYLNHVAGEIHLKICVE